MTRWEYTARVCTTADLNELGADGWELVSAVYDSDRMFTICYFKRPKEA
ncbi:hypothetical protein [Streptosporangium sp. NPDC002607]